MLSFGISNQAWPSSSTTKIAKPLKTLTRNLVILIKRKNSPYVLTMANLKVQIIGATIIKNVRSSPSTITLAITNVNINPRKEPNITHKVKMLVYINYLIHFPIPITILFH